MTGPAHDKKVLIAEPYRSSHSVTHINIASFCGATTNNAAPDLTPQEATSDRVLKFELNKKDTTQQSLKRVWIGPIDKNKNLIPFGLICLFV